MTTPRVSVVITTRNRRDEVTVAIESVLQQSEPCEVLVFDDASSDGTSEWIRTRYSTVRLITCERPRDSCVNRNEGFRLATGEFIISLDDDSFLSTDSTARQVVEIFDSHPNATILSLAYVEPRSGPERTMRVALDQATPMGSYVACAAAFRRAAVLALGGYRNILVHQGEERDLAIRVLDNRQSILYATTPPIVHLYSPKRNHGRMNYYGYRNTILFCWMRIPFPECVFRATVDTIQLVRYKFSVQTILPRLWALAAGWCGAMWHWSERRPVRRETYKLYRRLARHGPLPLSDAQRDDWNAKILQDDLCPADRVS